MKLVPISAQHLRVDQPLPFGLRDADGRLILAAGQLIKDLPRLAELTSQDLFADESESAEWTRRVAAAMDAMIRQGAVLKNVVAVRADSQREQARPATLSFTEQWLELAMHLDGALRDIRNADWRARLLSVHLRARQLAQRRLDASLYHLVYESGETIQKYSCRHALLSMVICEQAASLLGWEQGWIDSLGRAALVMNVAMLRQQDQMAAMTVPPNAEQRALIERHSALGAALLTECKLGDPLAVAVVALHHDTAEAERSLAELPPERQLARLLRRVDIFGAKISRRAGRAPRSPVQAAREACLGPGGVPDEIGSAMLKAVGLYPPGSFVELTSGEIGIVVARGRRADLPIVASLVGVNGNPLGEPLLRDTIERRHAVKGALLPTQVKIRPPHERLLALR